MGTPDVVVAPAPQAGSPIEGPSFPVVVRALATLLWVIILGLASRQTQALWELPMATKALLLAALLVVFLTWWAMLRSRTSIDDLCIRQTWLWTKEASLADVVQVKLVRVRGLEWLVTPRLVARVRGAGLIGFPTADARVLRAFELFVSGAPSNWASEGR